MHGLDKIEHWTVARALYEFERYNGFGYIKRKVNSPYLWSYSTLYERGKYIADGKWSASAVSSQCGAAVILRCMIDLGLIDDPDSVERIHIPPAKAAEPAASVASGFIETLAKAFGRWLTSNR